MREIIISKNEQGQRLNKFLLKYLSEATSSFIYKMLRKKNIVLNDKKAKGDEILCLNDSVKLYLADETIDKFRNVNPVKGINVGKSYNLNSLHNVSSDKDFNKPSGINSKLYSELTVIYQDDNILGIHKPAGVLSQRASKEDYSVNEFVVNYCLDNHIVTNDELLTFKPAVCNRLDRNTSGIIIASASLKGAQLISEAIKTHKTEKYYLTIIKGVIPKAIRDKAYLSRDEKKLTSNVLSINQYERLNDSEKNNYSLIDTEFIPLSNNGSYSLIKVRLYTGKSHQIRTHLKKLGYYMAGDKKYGDYNFNKELQQKYGLKNHLLHACKMVINKEVFGSKNDIVIIDQAPEMFAKICKGEGIKWQPGILED